MPISCLTCREKVAVLRGCCRTCYLRHQRRIRLGNVTWDELQARGLVEPFVDKVRQQMRCFYREHRRSRSGSRCHAPRGNEK